MSLKDTTRPGIDDISGKVIVPAFADVFVNESSVLLFITYYDGGAFLNGCDAGKLPCNPHFHAKYPSIC